MAQINTQKVIEKLYNNDKLYMEKCLKIRTKEGKLVPFAMNPMQEKSEKLIYDNQISKNKPVRVIWLKARQHGISTYCEAKIFKKTATNPFRNSMIIAHEDKATQNLFAMSKLFYEELPPVLRPMKKYSNESALVFENPTNDENIKYTNPGLRSKITVATAKNVDTGRSSMLHSLHASEVAFWDNPETLMTGLLQCVPDLPNTEVFIESTANGVGGWFYDLWQKAVKGENDYLPIFLAWFENPEYSKPFTSEAEKEQFISEVERITKDNNGNEVRTEEWHLKTNHNLKYEQLNWRKWCINNKLNGDVDLFCQEYPATADEAFIVSGRPVFNIQSLNKYKSVIKKPIMTGYIINGEFVEDKNGYISVWKKPEQEKFYVIGGDVAEGLATGDYSCLCVLDEQLDLCASWHGHIDPDLFGDEAIKLAKMYNDAYIGIESNNHGLTALKSITNKEYWNVFYQKTYDKINDQITQKLGWSTNIKTKPLMINKLAEYVRERYLGIYWDTLINELYTYVIDDEGRTNAQQGAHDDTVMALAIALQLCLEGRGDNYVPEIPIDENKRAINEDGNYGSEETDVESESIEVAN
jgi:hypothetical protein